MADNEKKLDEFTTQSQLAAFFCWAAASRNVANYYAIIAGTQNAHIQCSIAAAMFPRLVCCPNPDNGPCDKPWQLEKALRHVGHYTRRRPNAISWETLVREIDAGRPVGAHITWSSGGGHSVVITGYFGNLAGTQQVFVDDSQGGRTIYSFRRSKIQL